MMILMILVVKYETSLYTPYPERAMILTTGMVAMVSRAVFLFCIELRYASRNSLSSSMGSEFYTSLEYH